MLTTTPEFDTEIAKRNNRRVYGKIQINWTSPEYDQDIVVTVNNEARISYKDQTINAIDDPRYKWFSLDGSCLADGSYHPMPSTEAEAVINEVGMARTLISAVLQSLRKNASNKMTSIQPISKVLFRL